MGPFLRLDLAGGCAFVCDSPMPGARLMLGAVQNAALYAGALELAGGFAAARFAEGEAAGLIFVRVGLEHLRARFGEVSEDLASQLTSQTFALGPAGRALQASARFAREAPFARLS